MSIFDDLNARYVSFETARLLQHNLLVKAVGGIAGGFEKHLGLNTPFWHHDDGKRGNRYVRLGVGAPESFEEKAWQTLSSMNGVVSFSLAVTLESKLSLHHARMTFVFEGSARFCPDGYDFAFKDVPGPIIISAEKVKAEEFEPVYDALVGSLNKLTDPSRVEIVS